MTQGLTKHKINAASERERVAASWTNWIMPIGQFPSIQPAGTDGV